MDDAMLKQLVTSQLGRAPTDEEMARISAAMGAIQTGQIQPGQTMPGVDPQQAAAAGAALQGRMGGGGGGDSGAVNYYAGPAWSGAAPSRAGGGGGYMTDAPQYSWDGAGPGNYATGPEADRASMFAAQDAGLADNMVNKSWQTAQAGTPSSSPSPPPTFKGVTQDIEKKKAFVAGVNAATAGIAKPLPTGGTELADAKKKAGADIDALQAEADNLPAPGPGAAKQVPIGDAPALTEANWNDADPAEKAKKYKAEAAKAGKSLTAGELQMLMQKDAAKKAPAPATPAAKPKFDQATGTFSGIPVGGQAPAAPATPAGKPKFDPTSGTFSNVPMAGPTKPSKAEVENHLGMTITDAQYKQYLAKNG